MIEIFEHTADLGLRVRAGTLEGVFGEAAAGLMAMIVANGEDIVPREERSFVVPGTEPDLLLFDWLTELLYLFDTEQFLLRDFHVELDPTGLRATGRGEPADRSRHRLEHEVKAITYHALVVRREGDEWLAEVIVDI